MKATELRIGNSVKYKKGAKIKPLIIDTHRSSQLSI